MDSILSNPGFHHVGRQILSNLDFKTLWRCRAVSPTWRDFIDNAFRGIVEKWRRFQVKGDFIIYETDQHVKCMDYHPEMAQFLQETLTTHEIRVNDFALWMGVTYVKTFGNVKNLAILYRETLRKLEKMEEEIRARKGQKKLENKNVS